MLPSDTTSRPNVDPIKNAITDDSLANVLKAFEMLRLLDREIPGQLVSCFLYIASHNPCHKQAIEQDLSITPTSASRLTAWLSDYHRLGKPGLGLIKKVDDPSNYRRKLLKLTPKGESLANQLKGIIYAV